MYKLFLCLRYLRRRKIIYFSIAGVVVGMLVLIVVTSVMGGFSRDLKDRIRGVSSHIVITSPDNYIWRYEQIIERVKRVPHVVAVSPHVEHFCSIYYRGRQFTTAKVVKFIGIDPVREIGSPGVPGTSELASYLLDGKSPDFTLDGEAPRRPGILLGCEILDHYRGKKAPAGGKRADKTDDYVLKGFTFDLVTLKDKPASILPGDVYQKQFTVVGRFQTGMVDYDAPQPGLMYMPLKAAQEFLHIEDTVTHIAVRLDDYARAGDVKKAIEAMLAGSEDLRLETRGLRVMTWEELPDKQSLLQAVEVEKAIQAIILFFIVLVAGFNILAMLTLIVDLKTRDIGVLMALGATRRGVSGLFLLNGLLIGIIGSLLGVALGLTLAYTLNPLEKWIGKTTGYRLFDPRIYYLEGVPSEVNYHTIALIVGVTFIVSLVCSVYPAWKAAKLDPVEAIRHE